MNKKFRENRRFIDHLVTLFDTAPEKLKEITERLIWRLGSVDPIASKTSEKQLDDDQLPLMDDAWDEYDVLISVSNNVTDRVLSAKIYNRLVKQGHRVYSENSSVHRLEVMRNAIEKNKPIIVCLSSHYRSSKLCMAEAEYAQKRYSPIIPVLLQSNFKLQGWLKFLLGDLNPIDLTEKDFEKKMLVLYDKIEQFKSSD